LDIKHSPYGEEGVKKIRICVDFRNLNRVTPKDEYPMPNDDELINKASGIK
jgi:hypothetical protein